MFKFTKWGYFEYTILSYLIKIIAVSIPIMYFLFWQEVKDNLTGKSLVSHSTALAEISYFVLSWLTLLIAFSYILLFLFNKTKNLAPTSFFLCLCILGVSPAVPNVPHILVFYLIFQHIDETHAFWLGPLITAPAYWFLAVKFHQKANECYRLKSLKNP